MSDTDHLAFLRDPRLADLAAAPLPAWLWGLDADRIFWANAVGAALFGTTTVAALQQRRFDRKHAAAQQVARLANTLPAGGVARLERLRGFAPGIGRLLTCSCARIDLGDGTPAILVAATEPAGPGLALPDRVGRLLDGIDGPFAVFTAAGNLVLAAPQLRDSLGRHGTLAAAGGADLAASALAAGRAEGETPHGLLTLERIGTGGQLLLATLGPSVRQPDPAEPTVADDAMMAGSGHSEERADPACVPLAPDLPPDRAGPPAPSPPAPAAERRQPLRFVWQIDQDDRLTVTSDDFLAMIGPGVAAKLGRPWREVADELALDPEGRLAHALASRDTFSGIVVAWPIEGTADRLAAELSGLPVFDRDRSFRGFRGFGVCRDVARLAAIAAARRSPFVAPRDAAVGENPAPDAPPSELPSPGTALAQVPSPGVPHDAAAQDPAPSAPGRGEVPLPDDGAADAAAPSSDSPAPPAETTDASPAPAADRPQLTIVPTSKNVVPFRPVLPIAPDKRPALSPVETNAFREIAKALGARVEGDEAAPADAAPADKGEMPDDAGGAPPSDSAGAGPSEQPTAEDPAKPAAPSVRGYPRPIPSAYAAGADSATLRAPAAANGERAVLDRLPVGVLICRGETLLHANRAVLEWTGYEDVDAIAAAGGLDRLLAEPGLAGLGEPGGSGRSLAITTRRGESLPVQGRLFSVTWHDGTALLIVLMRAEAEDRATAAEDALRAAKDRAQASEAALAASDERLKAAELALRSAETSARELESVLETATDGVVVVDRDGMILASNRSAEALFGYESHELINRSFVDLFAPGSPRRARLAQRADARGRRPRAQRRTRSDRPRAAGRSDPAVHDHRPDRRRKILHRVPRHHAVEARRGGSDQRQARSREGIVGEIRRAGQGQPRDPHAAQRHHRLRRSHDGGAPGPGRQRALPPVPQGYPHLRRARDLAGERSARPVEDRGGQLN